MADAAEQPTGSRTKRTATAPAKTPAKAAATKAPAKAPTTAAAPAKRTTKSAATSKAAAPTKATTKKATTTPAKRPSTATKAATSTTTRTPTASRRRTTAATAAATAAKAPSRPATPQPATPRPRPKPAPVFVEAEAESDPDPEPQARIFTPSRPVADDGRPKASSVIADLWLEREQQLEAAAPPPPVDPRQPRTGTPSAMSGKAGLVAAIVALAVLLGGGVGVYLAHAGVGVPSKTTFIAKADAVCSKTNAPVAAVPKPSSYPELATAVATVVTAADTQSAALGKVHLPGGTARTAAADAIGALTAMDQAAHSLADAAAKKDDAATATATSHLMTQFSDATAKTKAFGFISCGSGLQTGMDNVTGGAKGLVKTSFMAKADSLCREASRKLDALVPFKSNQADIARYFGQGVDIMTKASSDLRALPAPPGDEATIADMLAAQDKVNAKVGELRDAAAAGNQSRFIAAGQELDVLGTAADAKLDAYGLAVCGSNFGES